MYKIYEVNNKYIVARWSENLECYYAPFNEREKYLTGGSVAATSDKIETLQVHSFETREKALEWAKRNFYIA